MNISSLEAMGLWDKNMMKESELSRFYGRNQTTFSNPISYFCFVRIFPYLPYVTIWLFVFHVDTVELILVIRLAI